MFNPTPVWGGIFVVGGFLALSEAKMTKRPPPLQELIAQKPYRSRVNFFGFSWLLETNDKFKILSYHLAFVTLPMLTPFNFISSVSMSSLELSHDWLITLDLLICMILLFS